MATAKRTADPFGDEEQRSFIDRFPRRATFTDIADGCLAKFGARRAWPRAKIIEYWDRVRAPEARRSKLDRDAEVAAFVDDRLGRMTIRELLKELDGAFDPTRRPSRSAIGRYWRTRRGLPPRRLKRQRKRDRRSKDGQ